MFEITATRPVNVPVQIGKPERYYTLEEFLRREERSQELHEFIGGKIIQKPMAKLPHNLIATNVIGASLKAFEGLDKNYLVLSNQQLVYFPLLDEAVYPDVLVVCEKPVLFDTGQLLLINPLLVVEVLSRSTRKYDRGDKFMKYKTLQSFREYVMIEQDQCRIETWFRQQPGLWQETIMEDLSASIHLQSVGCSIALAEIYRNIVFPEKKAKSKK